ncbi:P-loop containing nucleoside triphosphate hydrolase protein [Obelidium mucronatum]|nr:P-loop containing nucleoside triphosphate hydrolase protein [Obelidium mucronatum]
MPAEAVIVCVRCRPFSEKEKERVSGAKKCVQIQPDRGAVSLQSPKSEEDIKNFTFDAAFDENCTQIEVYNSTARIIVDAVLNGFNGTVFCYGQTGTGKTFSMQGISNVPHLRGIIPNAFNHIFDHIARSKHKKFLVRVSFLEIYNEEIRDLLVKKSKGGLELKEHPETGVYVKDLSGYVVKSVAEMEQLMTVGNNARSVGATLMNETSSRSHSIFTITIESSEAGGGVDGEDRFVLGKLHLVDLAGSERQSKTGASGDRLKEATKINLSLSALGNCISALVDGKSSHIPYRDSKLTRLLQDSLGGNAKTLMIATLSPASYNYDETLSTLRYANRAKNIKNKPKVNEDPKDAMLREYQEEINKLKQALEAKQKGTTVIKKVVRKKIMKKVKKPSESSQLRGANGGAASDDESESSDDSDDGSEGSDGEGSGNTLSGLDVETIARLEAEVDAEKKALLASKNMVIEEKQKIAAELEKRAQELEAERQTREHIAKKLAAMEDKLLVGGVNIIDRVAEKEKELELAQLAVRERKRAERELQQRVENKQELQLQMEENYASLQEEVDKKSEKLKKLWAKVQAAKAEISDLHDEFRNEREDLLDTIRELSRELSLKVSVIENFIPIEEGRKIETRAVYDEETNDWKLHKLTSINLSNKVKRPCALKGTKRPLSQYARTVMMANEGNFRYYPENIIRLKIDLNHTNTPGTYSEHPFN